MVMYFIKNRRHPHNHLSASQPVTYNVEAGTNSIAVPSDQVQSQPTGGDKSLVSHMEVVNDTSTVTDGDTVPIVQDQSQPVVSLKWQKYKAGINKKGGKNIDEIVYLKEVVPTSHIINSLNYTKVVNELLTILIPHLRKNVQGTVIV